MEPSGGPSKSRAGESPGLFVAAFGKHPGWNDHIDDLGLETERLVAIKQRMYVEGIAGNIDSGAWDKLAPEQQVDEFDHDFVWRLPGGLVVGRMWSSRDGKGRAKYPMVVCVECVGLPLVWALAESLPLLTEIQRRCVETTDSGTVRATLDEARARLRESARRRQPTGPQILVSDRVLSDLAGLPEVGTTGVHRLLYQIEREMSDYLPANLSVSRSRSGPSRPHQMRAPGCGTDSAAVLMLWMRFYLSRLAPSSEVLLFHPRGRGWVDAIVGPPDVQAFYCLRASPKALAPATEVPYDLDPEFLERVNRQIEEGRTAEELPLGGSRPSVTVVGGGFMSKLAFWKRGRGILLIVLLIGLAAAATIAGLVLERAWGVRAQSGQNSPAAKPPDTASPKGWLQSDHAATRLARSRQRREAGPHLTPLPNVV